MSRPRFTRVFPLLMVAAALLPAAAPAGAAPPDIVAELVVDLNPGPASSYAFGGIVFQGNYYFVADDGLTGFELWCFDGTTVSQVADIWPGPGSSLPGTWVEFDGVVYFTADDGTNGLELWRFDGTTVSIAHELIPGPTPSFVNNVRALTVFNDELIVFGWNDGTTGAELWGFDGTTPRLIADLRANLQHLDLLPDSHPFPIWFNIHDYNGALYFSADDGIVGTELWRYDGVTTELVADIYPGPGGSTVQTAAVFQGKLYFMAQSPDVGFETHVYDGSTVSVLMDLWPGPLGASRPATVFDGQLWGLGNDGVNGSELWHYDGISPPEVIDFRPGPAVGPFVHLLVGDRGVFDGRLWLSADDGITGREIWTLDTAGTFEQVLDLNPGLAGSNPLACGQYEGALFFRADDGVHGSELWRLLPASGNAPPDCSDARPSIDTLWPPNHEMVGIAVEGVTDPDGDTFTIRIDSVFQDEPVCGEGDGSTSPDGSGVGASTAWVRAERDGRADGRVYHVTFTATDTGGATSTGEILVTVPLTGKKAAIDGGALFDSTAPDGCDRGGGEDREDRRRRDRGHDGCGDGRRRDRHDD